jgi:hypothetical protein
MVHGGREVQNLSQLCSLIKEYDNWISKGLVLFSLFGFAACAGSHPSMTHTIPAASMIATYASINSTLFTDNSADLLEGDPEGAQVAHTPPTVAFQVLAIDAQKYSTDYGDWGNVVRGPDGKYYYGLGDHSAGTGGHDGALLMDYDPVKKQSNILLFSKDILGPGGEGKWHCRMDINPFTGDMYFIGFYNGDLIHYNIYSHRAENMGKPSPGDGWPEGAWDWQRNRYYAVGDGKGGILVYDTLHHTTIHTGLPVDVRTGKMFWWSDRARLIDRATGMVYGSDQDNHITKYDPFTNTFTIMKSTLRGALRAWTNEKNADGSFWIFDTQGNIFKFYPEQDRVQYMGKNWGNGVYSASIERSSDGKYLYYSIADNHSALAAGVPIIQYNTQTNEKKVIAFLSPFYAKAHGYAPNKIYGEALSADGSSLFVVSNGNMVNGPRYPAIYNIAIPTSERG